ncbi:MAG: hypothetical protein HYU42_02620 [Candidatus Rokubacteria bacterium]|nr:hypothetical protein [Candidatus Rokubacteria bacterium]
MDRRTFIGTLAVFLLAVPLAAEAQAPVKGPRIGFLAPFPPTDDLRLEAFRRGLRELGHVEGQSIAIEYRFADGRHERLPALAAELVRLKADTIVTGPSPALLAGKQATSTIPIIFAVTGDPVAEGLAASLGA